MTSRYHRDHRSERRAASPRHRSYSRDDHDNRHHDRHHHRSSKHRDGRSVSPSSSAPLPFNAAKISKYDYDRLHDVFAEYLDIQKDLKLRDLDRHEARGRFKRFVTHYNRGDLARGWYERVVNNVATGVRERSRSPSPKRSKRDVEVITNNMGRQSENDTESSSEDTVGPALPGQERRRRKPGPAIPREQDLQMQQEQLQIDAEQDREDLRHERRLDRRQQKERLEELVPRAEPGTRERQLEKKREVNDKMKSFREKSPEVEVDDSTLMGDGGGLEGYKQKKAAMERKKNERELRREQLLRSRIAEREERLQEHREKEERTMAMLKQMASRFQ